MISQGIAATAAKTTKEKPSWLKTQIAENYISQSESSTKTPTGKSDRPFSQLHSEFSGFQLNKTFLLFGSSVISIAANKKD